MPQTKATFDISKRNKDDEFYTLYEDIENELKYYSTQLENKTVYCNCDDYDTSNFVKYFIDKFDEFKLNKLIATCYQKENNGKLFIKTKDGEHKTTLIGNGDFNNDENIDILKEADIVITNPPYSKLRQYLSQLLNFNN